MSSVQVAKEVVTALKEHINANPKTPSFDEDMINILDSFNLDELKSLSEKNNTYQLLFNNGAQMSINEYNKILFNNEKGRAGRLALPKGSFEKIHNIISQSA